MCARKIGMWMYQNGGGDAIEKKLIQGLKEREIETISGLNLRSADAHNGGVFCNGVAMDKLDLYFSYNAGEQTLYQAYLYEILDRYIPIINSFKGFSLSEDKMKTNMALNAAAVPSANFYLCHRDDVANIKATMSDWNSKIVYKPVDGWGGMGMALIEGEDDLDMILPFLNQIDVRFLYIEKFMNFDGTDYRVDVVDGEVLGCYGRRVKKGGWRTNVTSGGSVFLRELDDALVDIALKATKAVDLDIAGVDIIYDQDREEYIVLEVNGIPAFATPDQEDIGLSFNARKIEKIIELIDRKTTIQK